jgi:hypothetical protein
VYLENLFYIYPSICTNVFPVIYLPQVHPPISVLFSHLPYLHTLRPLIRLDLNSQIKFSLPIQIINLLIWNSTSHLLHFNSYSRFVNSLILSSPTLFSCVIKPTKFHTLSEQWGKLFFAVFKSKQFLITNWKNYSETKSSKPS